MEGSMKKSFYITILAMAAVLVASTATADSVDIGLGEMDRAEFERLQKMVRGEHQPSTVASERSAREIYVAEFRWEDVQSIRQAMNVEDSNSTQIASASGNNRVDIGLGSMSTTEFCDLNKLVASNTNYQKKGFDFICP
jgi:hypothetical protein